MAGTLKFPWVDVCGLLSALAFGLLAFLSHSHVSVGLLLGCLGAAWIGCLGAFWAAHRPGQLTFQRLLFWALVFRVIVWFGEPIFTDDVYRYLWDGRAFAEQGTPYRHAPMESFGDFAVPDDFQRILDRVRDPQETGFYAPLSEYLFLFAHWIAPGQTWPLKVFLLLGDFLAIIALSRLCGPRQTLLYAWCPLLLQESFFNLHPDLIGAALLLLGANHLLRFEGMQAALVSALALGLHALAAPVAAWILWLSDRWAWFSFFLGGTLFYGYFFYQGDGAAWLSVLAHWQSQDFNSFLAGLLGLWLNPTTAKIIGLAAFTLALFFWARYTLQHRRTTPRFDVLYALFFVCAPAVHPWTVLWMLPWVALQPRAWTMTVLIVVSLSYLTGFNLGDPSLAPSEHPWWVRPLEFALVFNVWLVEKFILTKPEASTGERLSAYA